MTIIGIGTELIDISFFSSKPFDNNKKYYETIFTSDEIAYCTKYGEPYSHFAARYCAKVALRKALNDESIDLKAIEVKLVDHAPRISYKKYKIAVSLTHEKDKAAAMVIVEE